jgi:hypothetical protein
MLSVFAWYGEKKKLSQCYNFHYKQKKKEEWFGSIVGKGLVIKTQEFFHGLSIGLLTKDVVVALNKSHKTLCHKGDPHGISHKFLFL